MFDTLTRLDREYGATIDESIMKDSYGNSTLISYEIDMDGDMGAIVQADYYMLSTEIDLKFVSGLKYPIDWVREFISNLDDLTLEIQNYFEELRKST